MSYLANLVQQNKPSDLPQQVSVEEQNRKVKDKVLKVCLSAAIGFVAGIAYVLHSEEKND